MRPVSRFILALIAITSVGGRCTAQSARVLFVLNSSTPAIAESQRIATLQGLGHTVTTIASTESQANFDTAMAAADVVYIGPDANSLSYKVREATIGVFVETMSLVDEMGFSTTSANGSFNSNQLYDQGTGNPILADWPGVIYFTNSNQPIALLSGTIGAGVLEIGEWNGQSYGVSVIEVGGTLVNTHNSSNTAFGRRVAIPLPSSFDWSDLSSDGETVIDNAIDWLTPAANNGKTVLLVVENTSSLNSEDLARKTQFESWGYTVSTIQQDDSQANFDAAVATADVAYVTEDVLSGNVEYKLRTASIGVVSEERALDPYMGFSTSSGISWTSTSVVLTNNTHPITSGLSLGTLSLVSSSQPLVYTQGTVASGATVLAEQGGDVDLLVLEKGATLANTHSGNSTASGRRVRLPWGGDTFDWSALNSNGLLIVENALDWASSALAGHWRFDETSGTTAADSSNKGRDGTLVGSPSWITDGVIYGGLTLTADATDHVTLPSGTLDGADDLSIAVWVRADGSATRRTLVSGANSSNSNEILLGISDTTVSFYDGEDDNTTSRILWTLPSSIAGGWHHLVIVRDSSSDQVLLYLDGELVGTESATLNPLDIDSGGLLLGEDQDSVGGGFESTDSFAGSIDDLRIYRLALDAPGVAEAYGLVAHWKLDETSGNVAADSSGGGNDAAIDSTVDLGVAGARDGAARCNDSDEISVSDASDAMDRISDDDGDLSVALWFKPEGVTGSARLLFDSGFAEVSLEPNGNEVEFELKSSSGDMNVTTVETIRQGYWTHIAAVKSGSTATIYLNGVAVHTESLPYPTSHSGKSDIEIGDNANSGVNGVLDDVVVYNRAMTSQEIAEHYGLVGHWEFDEGTGSTVADSSLVGNDASFNVGSPTWTSGIRGTALEFDGTNDARTDNTIIPPDRGAVALWFRSDGPPTSRQRPWGIGADYEMWQDTDGLVSMDLSTDGYQGGFITTTPLDSEGHWYHVVAQYDSTDESYEIYVNGVLHKSGTSTRDITQQPSNFLTFGTRTGSTQRFSGALDDFRIYNRWLPPSEIAELYGLVGHWRMEEGSGATVTDSSGAGNHGTFVGAGGWSTNSREGNGSLDLDGTNHVEIPSLILTEGSATVSGWARLTDNDTNGSELITLGNHLGIRIDSTLSGQGSYGYAYNGSSWNDVRPNIYHENTGWHHFTMVADDENLERRFYIDGVLMATVSGGPLVMSGQNSSTLIGTRGTSLYDFTGQIDDVRVYNRVITPEELRTLYYGTEVLGPRIVRWVEVANP